MLKRFAGALAGAVLALGALCGASNAQMVNAQTGTSYTFVNGDCDPSGKKLVTFSNASSVAVTLPQSGASGQFVAGCAIVAVNLGAGTVTVTPTTSTINGASSIALPQYSVASIRPTALPSGTGNYVAQLGNVSMSQCQYYFTGTIAANNQVFCLIPRAMRLVSLSEVHSTAAGGTSTMDVIRDTGTATPCGGTSVFSTGSFNLNATANTVQTAAIASAQATMAAGDRLCVKYNNTIQSSAGVVVAAGFIPY